MTTTMNQRARKKKRSSPEELVQSLSQPHFSESQKISPGVLSQAISITLPIVEIDEYPHNPRSVSNRKHEEILSSIRQRGYEGVFEVTKQPGSVNYQVSRGQNTRLRICKYLFQEEGDERFRNVLCRLKPWTDDFDEHISHLSENDQRDSLIFRDRARGLRTARDFLTARLGKKPSLSEFVESLKSSGYPIDRGTLTRYDYVLDVLSECIPEALAAGLGSTQIKAIRALDRALTEVLSSAGHSKEQIKREFGSLLTKCDSPTMGFRQLEDAAIARLAELTGQTKKQASLALAATNKPSSSSSRVVGDDDSIDLDDDDASAGVGRSNSKASATKTSKSSKTEKGEDKRQQSPAVGPSNTLEDEIAPGLEPLEELSTLRRMAFETARQLAGVVGLSDLTLKIGQGVGFLIDLPDEPLADFAEEGGDFQTLYGSSEGANRVWAWWLSASIAEQLSLFRSSNVSQFFPESSRFAVLLKQVKQEEGADFASVMRQLVGQADLREFGEMFVGGAAPEAQASLIRLIQISQRIHQLSQRNNIQVWRQE